MTSRDPRGLPERLVDAVLADHPVIALAALRPELSGDLLAVADAARRRLGPVVVAGTPEADLLLAVSGRPGLSAAELRELVPAFGTAATVLLADGLVTSTRFERADCWTRTARGALALRDLTDLTDLTDSSDLSGLAD